jgi:hypothetical protein
VVAIATSTTARHDRPVNGWTLDEIEDSGKTLDFDLDPFEAQLWEAEKEDSDDE